MTQHDEPPTILHDEPLHFSPRRQSHARKHGLRSRVLEVVASERFRSK